MVTPQLISAYVPPEMKSRFRSLAEQRQMSESGLLRLLVDAVVRGVGELDAEVLKAPEAAGYEARARVSGCIRTTSSC